MADVNDLAAAIKAENDAVEGFRRIVSENADLLRPIAHWGDGRCGYLAQILCDELLPDRIRVPRSYAKKKIPAALSRKVFERDAYRCVECGDHHDLTCDHIVPESKGGETAFANLQTMCRPCNSRKGARV